MMVVSVVACEPQSIEMDLPTSEKPTQQVTTEHFPLSLAFEGKIYLRTYPEQRNPGYPADWEDDIVSIEMVNNRVEVSTVISNARVLTTGNIIGFFYPSDGSYQDRTLINVDISTNISISPDGQYLIFSKDETTYLYNLTSDDRSEIVSMLSLCSVWSPDSKKIQFVGQDYSGLFVYDLNTGAVTSIYTPPSDEYSISGVGEGREVFGRVSCGPWIGDDRFVFRRFVGEMPSALSMGFPEISTNTKTLATFAEDGFTLLDLPIEMNIISSCSSESSMLMLENENYVISDKLNDFTNIETKPLGFDVWDLHQSYSSSCWGGDITQPKFIPTTCNVYYVHANETQDISDDREQALPFDEVPYLYIVRPETLETKQYRWLYKIGMAQIFDRELCPDVLWLGDARAALFATIHPNMKTINVTNFVSEESIPILYWDYGRPILLGWRP